MGKIGDGYGSEYHLRRYLAEQQGAFNSQLADQLDTSANAIKWLPFPLGADGREREYKGLGFLPRDSQTLATREAWSHFWPTRGQQQNWDAVGRADGDWLLAEAKANQPEFCSPPTTAKEASGLPQIRRAMNRVKRELGVNRWFTWTGSYYQYANRLTMLWFLREYGVRARLVFIYFTGDVFPDGTPCPSSSEEWDRLIEARRLTLGLAERHALAEYEHHLVLPALNVKGALE